MKLTGITHALVDVPKSEMTKSRGVFATVTFCFGPGDDTFITGIQYIRGENGKPVWSLPSYWSTPQAPSGDHVFAGELVTELIRLAQGAIDGITRALGKAQANTRYKVYKDRVVVEAL